MQKPTNPALKSNCILKAMAKLFTLLCFLVLLVVPLRVAEQDYPDEGENDFESDQLLYWESEHVNKVLVNVDAFGAVGDGVSDDTQVINKL